MKNESEPNLSLLTDLYQLTMAYGYWKLGRSEQASIFHLFFRKPPFAGQYAIAAGLESVLQFLDRFRLDPSDVEYLASLCGNDGKPLFETGFLDYLLGMKMSVDVDAIPEGTAVFGHEPLLRIKGPLAQCQILETPLLNLINFQTLIATKASRIAKIAGDEPVLEFGLRRAQGIDGALSASRAAFIGGCSATSNVLAGKQFGIPVKGTHAHSWVMSFDDEIESFERYADVMPNNCIFLVDTYDTIEGVRNAIRVGKRLRERGQEMVGIRLDSGDLAQLSIQAREILDEQGFPDAAIVASNDLDEHAMLRLRSENAKISVWGIGTKLATAFDQPALGGVYKLGALRDDDGSWVHKVKLSEQSIKTSIPGKLQIRRYFDADGAIGDVIFDELSNEYPTDAIDFVSGGPAKFLGKSDNFLDLLQPVMVSGDRKVSPESLEVIQQRTRANLLQVGEVSSIEATAPRFPVALEHTLYERRQRMIERNR